MRICFFADASNIHTKRWTQYFAEKRYDVHLITPDVPIDYKIDRLTLHKIPYVHSLNTIILSLYYIKRLLKKIKPDILHGIFLSNCAFYAALTGFRPFIATALGSDVLVAPESLKRRYAQVKYTLKRARIVTVDAEIVKEKLMMMKYPDTKIKMIYFGVNSSILSIEKNNQNSLILSCRNLAPNYNIDVILEGYKLAKKRLPNSKLVVIGDISQHPELFCSDPGIEFLQPFPHAEIAKFMAKFNLFISVPTSDASSVSLLEAMALGLFPIVSDIPANREWIKNGYNGLLVPPGNQQILADKIVEAMENHKLRESAASINREIVNRKALFEDNMQKLEEIYYNLIKK